MISHCANPACKLSFHYLRGGRLYRFELHSPSPPCVDVPNAICTLKPKHAVVFFWLCEQCCTKFSLRFEQHRGLTLIPASNATAVRRRAPVVAVGVGGV